jgi:hypothetical protein
MAQALRQAAEEAEVKLPSRISLPLSFTTAEAPSESVAVFSGTARERIADAQFAEEDTDATLGQRLAAERAEVGQAVSELGKELLSATGALGRLAVGRMAKALHEAVEEAKGGLSEATSELEAIPSETLPEETSGEQPADADMDEVLAQRLQPERADVKPERGKVIRAILGAIGIVAVCNSMMLMVSLPTNWWALFEHGWPMQLFLVSLGLCLVMWATSSIWMLIPTGIVFGTGILLTYCSLTGNWDQWVFLWVFQLWIVAGSVAIPIWLTRRKEQARHLSRPIALLMGISSAVLVSIIAFASMAKSLLAWLTI